MYHDTTPVTGKKQQQKQKKVEKKLVSKKLFEKHITILTFCRWVTKSIQIVT